MNRVLNRAEEIAGQAPLGTEHVLQALLEDNGGVAGHVLDRFASRDEFLSALAGMTTGAWTSQLVEGPDGKPIVEPDGMLRQYLVDGDGHEILDADGRRQRLVLNPDRTPVLGEDGRVKLEPLPDS
ncbi:MAG TPA: Clp protease N-terminal domain-containing protein [Acidimicrobiales bacterium]|nr:Clp protease N-terminal domain-containing protein [Acidimicrobiales bacterium]